MRRSQGQGQFCSDEERVIKEWVALNLKWRKDNYYYFKREGLINDVMASRDIYIRLTLTPDLL